MVECTVLEPSPGLTNNTEPSWVHLSSTRSSSALSKLSGAVDENVYNRKHCRKMVSATANPTWKWEQLVEEEAAVAFAFLVVTSV